MKHFKYWSNEDYLIQIDGQQRKIRLLTGSNISTENAREESIRKAQQIEKRIAQRDSFDEYEVGIKEYVSEFLDESNVVTVCRYGARILNTNEYTILDLDDYPRRFFDRFKPLDGMTKKEKIIHRFEESVSRFSKLGADFRIYETANGIRVIGKNYLDPEKTSSIKLMKKINVDWLYMTLSRKQRCYRARLTPKPYRMGIKTIRVRSPLVCETDEYNEWSKMYETASRDYCVVRLVKSIGRDFSRDPVIRFHDEQCNAHKSAKLA